jgi:hypothetical protein
MNNDNSAAKIQECWGFDCLYGGKNKKTGEKYYTQPKGWIKWAKSNRNKNLYIYYQGSTEKESKYLEDNTRSDTNIGKISISRSNAKNHFWVPLKHWVERIRKAPLLDRVK